MDIFRVGGAVRDELLGLSIHDSDWVVVGATPEQLINKGFKPVGKDFPVFLHPKTHEEYALARTERKTGPGYKGFAVHFSPEVTLEEDLLRRDLTINAMARDDVGLLIDPHDGQTDLEARLFRHVSPAFCEDPVRILRVARFAARFGDFSVCAETRELMLKMVANGEVDALVAERVWKELSRGLMEASPQRLFEVLNDCDALPKILPGFILSPHFCAAIQYAADNHTSITSRYALICLSTDDHDRTSTTDALSRAVRAPSDCSALARIAVRELDTLLRVAELPAQALMKLLESLDAIRKPERIAQINALIDAWTLGKQVGVAHRLSAAANAAREVDAGLIAKAVAKDGPLAIKQAVFDARCQAIEKLAD